MDTQQPAQPAANRSSFVRVAGLCALIVFALCILATFSLSGRLFFDLISDDNQGRIIASPPGAAALLPGGDSSPRLKEIAWICRGYPAGSIGMSYETFQILPPRERFYGNDLSYLGFERIVRETGQPVRFKNAPPASITHILAFQDEAAKAGLGEPTRTFQDMGLYEIRSSSRTAP